VANVSPPSSISRTIDFGDGSTGSHGWAARYVPNVTSSSSASGRGYVMDSSRSIRSS
jgi:hypothetical protein